MQIRPIVTKDVDRVVDTIVDAFLGDPLIGFLFGPGWEHGPHGAEFFRILLEVRVALGMPAICAEEGGVILGAAMGYDSSRPAWEARHDEQWSRLLATVEGLEARLEEYGALADRFALQEPHFYLGVIGVRRGNQGRGIGAALLEEFCDASLRDAGSGGVYLETSSEASLRFYLKSGFMLRGEGKLGADTPLWCVYRSTAAGAAG